MCGKIPCRTKIYAIFWAGYLKITKAPEHILMIQRYALDFFRKTRSAMVPRFGFFPGFTDKGLSLFPRCALKQKINLWVFFSFFFRNNILTLSESALAEEIRLTKNRIHSQPSSKYSQMPLRNVPPVKILLLITCVFMKPFFYLLARRTFLNGIWPWMTRCWKFEFRWKILFDW